MSMDKQLHSVSCPIVGMHFRPPAKALMAALPSGAALRLVREPENPHDANAIQVFVEGSQVPEEMREECGFVCESMGFAAADVWGDVWHLGYIARQYAEDLAPRLRKMEEEKPLEDSALRHDATLAFAADGKPQAVLSVLI